MSITPKKWYNILLYIPFPFLSPPVPPSPPPPFTSFSPSFPPFSLPPFLGWKKFKAKIFTAWSYLLPLQIVVTSETHHAEVSSYKNGSIMQATCSVEEVSHLWICSCKKKRKRTKPESPRNSSVLTFQKIYSCGWLCNRTFFHWQGIKKNWRNMSE